MTSLEVPAGNRAAFKAWRRALELTSPIVKNPSRTLPMVIADVSEKWDSRVALASPQNGLTYGELARLSNQYSRWAFAQRLTKGDVVCLFMPSRPEYIAIWLGISATGCIVSLLNTNLTGRSLAHCISVASPKHVIVDAALIDTFLAVTSDLPPAVKVSTFGDAGLTWPRVDIEATCHPTDRAATDVPVTIEDTALHIYTSGTSGLPKAANVSHRRLMQWTHWFSGLMDISSDDKMYNCLPMYHSVGGVVATGAVLVAGGSVEIREKLSVSHFWQDVVQSECTVFQYIGEMCRYLLQNEPSTRERNHRIRICCGNGLSGDIWEAFKDRFRIPQILEFYASTEDTFSLFNVEGKPGAIGRIPPFLAHRFPARLVKFNYETGQPIRNNEGFCIPCKPNETGEALGLVRTDPASAVGRFDGYTSGHQSAQRIVHNVFQPGDSWFRTGDLMRQDESGYFYFVDRVGDTFRWKSENVATTEVRQVICSFAGVRDAAVYGVVVPHAEGRAGMATIVTDGIDLVAFRRHLVDNLPSYACPVFVRLRLALDLTSTYKQVVQGLAAEGYGPQNTKDIIYFNDEAKDSFVVLDEDLFNKIQAGQIRL